MAEEAEEEAEDILKGIRDLLLKERKEEVIYLTYPANGGTKDVTDTLEINAYTGEVFADGAEEYLSGSLQRHGLKYVRSLFIETNKAIKIQLDDGGKLTTGASKIINWNHTKPFQRLTMTTTTTGTKIKVLITNEPDMFLFVNSV